MTAQVLPFSLVCAPPLAQPTETPAPAGDAPAEGGDDRTPPTPTELEAARYYTTGYYTRQQFIDVCNGASGGTETRALAAWATYDRAKTNRGGA